ncbi:hypothetical protein K432DRAFT_424627 [Lepidopterella palustris CBS 459.81]|uniref:Uncharacterized protein n=1 Tax=Lepidopterella palustris CBS 459.81 TaxID=1314670 RepID=A0A8E2JGP2_9PEZI|nr:hypothetical protein K432DRAFT_424627 [Lepidopterella palustris CBS 459.81]
MIEERCWRCIILNDPCDSEDICKTCTDNSNKQHPNLECRRGMLANQVNDGFSCM